MKRIITITLALLLIVFAAGCTPEKTADPTVTPEATKTPEATPVPFPEIEEETVKTADLGSYTIVYPSAYTEIRMDVPTMLADTIEKVIGKRPEIKSDKDCTSGKRIILASGETKTVISNAVEAFDDGLSYVIAVSEGNIILGGKNYYADSNAVYDFVNNVLGWDDVYDEYSVPTESVNGVKVVYHEKPPVIIMGSTWASIFDTPIKVKTLADANFNGIMYTIQIQNEYDHLHESIRLFARYGIYVVMNRGVMLPELYYDCPVILGHNIWDEPWGEEIPLVADMLKDYKEKYSQYGWKSWVNMVGSLRMWEPVNDLWVWADNDVSGFDYYPYIYYNRDIEMLHAYELSKQSTDLHGQEVWYYIQSYNHIGYPGCVDLNTDKAYRWQMYYTMCFDPDSIIYFVYGMEYGDNEWADWYSAVVPPDMVTRGENFYAAQRANREILDVAEYLEDYDYKGAFTINRKSEEYWSWLESPYDFSYIIENIEETDDTDIYLAGCYENEDKAAFILTNVSFHDGGKYDDTQIGSLKVKLSGENVSVYRDGKTEEILPDEDGYYSLPTGDGVGILVMLDKKK